MRTPAVFAVAGRFARSVAPLALALGLAAPLPASAALFEDSEARRAILDVRGRLDAAVTRLEEVARKVEDLSARMSRAEAASRGQFDMQNQLESLRQELARLRGQIEVATNELSQTQRRQRDLASDLDSRLKQFEPVAVTVDGRQVNVDQNEKRAYEGALAMFRSGDFKPALNAFQQFQLAYPQSAYLPSAVYWTASSQYALRDYKAALTTMQSFLQRFGDHPRAGDAWLVIGNAHFENGDRKAARDAYQTVLQKYEGTPAAQAARERLSALPKQ